MIKDTNISLITAFSIGITNSFHCLGMCGGIVTILSLSLSDENKKHILKYQIFYSIGRILGYAFINIIIFFIGLIIVKFIGIKNNNLLKLISGLILVIIGLHSLIRLNFFKTVESLTWKIWSFFYPKIKIFFPVKNILQAIFLGFIWAHIPCGLIYSVSIWAASSGILIKSLLLTILFGIGTLPVMLGAVFFSIKLKDLLRTNIFKNIINLLIICFGLFTIYTFFLNDNCH